MGVQDRCGHLCPLGVHYNPVEMNTIPQRIAVEGVSWGGDCQLCRCQGI